MRFKIKMAGQLTEEDHHNLFRSYFTHHPIVSVQQESFDAFINNGIAEIINQEPTISVCPKSGCQYIVEFSNPYVAPPQVIEEDRTLHRSSPYDCRIRGLTYDSALFCDIKETRIENDKIVEVSDEESSRRILLARIPIMLGSSFCVLHNKSPEGRIALNECPNDAGGYFIIKGHERVLVSQMRTNYNHIFVEEGDKKSLFTSSIRSMSSETGHSVLVKACLLTNDKTIVFNLPLVKDAIPVGIVFKALGYEHSDMINIIALQDPHAFRYYRFIRRDTIGMERKDGYTEQDIALSYIAKRAMRKDNDNPIRHAKKILEAELFPHLGLTSTCKERAIILGEMINKLISTRLGLRKPDNKDNIGNKRVETAGILCYELFRTLYKKFLSKVKSELEKKKDNLNALSIISKSKNITSGLRVSFSTGNWGVQKNAYIRTGVSQVLDRMTYASYLSHLRRIIIQVGKQGKNTLLRQIDSTQYGFICPHETPEGKNAGTVLNFAMSSTVSPKINKLFLAEILLTIPNIIKVVDVQIESIHMMTRIYLNKVIFGFTLHSEEIIETLRNLRRREKINRYTSIAYDPIDDRIDVCCDEGRFVRPVLKVDKNNNLLISSKDTTRPWEELIKNDLIYYIDAAEMESIVIAMTPAYLKLQKCSACEIHPYLVLGIVAGMIPFPDHTQSPRVCYQSSMGKQALGIPVCSFNKRTDTVLHVMWYGHKKLVRTWMNEIIKADQMPSGQVAIVALISWSGYNQEDSVIMSQSAIQRGMFAITVYKAIDDEEKKGDSHTTEFIDMVPENSPPEVKQGQPGYFKRKNCNYSILETKGPNKGIIRKGIHVKKGDPIISKYLVTYNKGGEEIKIDKTKLVEPGQEGVVDRVYVRINPDGHKVVQVVIRSVRFDIVGNKVACYDPETDILTSRGWIGVKELTLEDKVACLVGEKEVKYLKPTALHAYDYEGKMYRVQSDKVDLKVTPNHRMYCGNVHRDNYKIVQASDIYGKMKSYKNNAEEWKGENSGVNACSYKLKGCEGLDDLIIPLEEWCLFFGIWIAEGCCSVSNYKNGTIRTRSVNISAEKDRVRETLKLCMEKIPLRHNLHMKKGELHSWYCSDPRLIKYLKPLSVGAVNKRLPKWCFKVNQHYARKLVEGMILGDGHYMKGTTTERYSTSSIGLRDDFQRLCLHAGWGCSYRLKYPAGHQSQYLDSTITSTVDHWSLTVCKTQTHPLVNKYIKKGKQLDSWEDYKGKVYCCTVPTEQGIIYVRRNGLPIWSGNSCNGQKGTIGNTYTQENLPFTRDGITPDIIVNPHGFPGRMTINQLIETVTGKVSALTGEFEDCTPFTDNSVNAGEKISKKLAALGFERNGNEILTNPYTGEEMGADIFIGPTYYQKLKHMVEDKIHARAKGPLTMLTRQPVEGRRQDGGLRWGEMERDNGIAHGLSDFLRERLFKVSDPFLVNICADCGIITSTPSTCQKCKGDQVIPCNIPYASKLLVQELNQMGLKVLLWPKK